MPKTITDAITALKSSSFPFTEGLIYSFIGGSQLHGAKLEGNDDLDIYGVFLEPAEKALGLDCYEHFVTSTSGNEKRNGPEDVDICLYSLRKWVSLAAKGNPTALHFLFASQHYYETPVWMWIKQHQGLFLSQKAYLHFRGFADAQLKRLTGRMGQGKHGQRPELEERFGYDVKAGMHVVRLLNEGIELMQHHKITLPRPEKDLLIHIRKGGWSQDKLCNEANKLFEHLDDAASNSTLPERVDRERLSKLVASTYIDFWNGSYALAGSSTG